MDIVNTPENEKYNDPHNPTNMGREEFYDRCNNMRDVTLVLQQFGLISDKLSEVVDDYFAPDHSLLVGPEDLPGGYDELQASHFMSLFCLLEVTAQVMEHQVQEIPWAEDGNRVWVSRITERILKASEKGRLELLETAEHMKAGKGGN